MFQRRGPVLEPSPSSHVQRYPPSGPTGLKTERSEAKAKQGEARSGLATVTGSIRALLCHVKLHVQQIGTRAHHQPKRPPGENKTKKNLAKLFCSHEPRTNQPHTPRTTRGRSRRRSNESRRRTQQDTRSFRSRLHAGIIQRQGDVLVDVGLKKKNERKRTTGGYRKGKERKGKKKGRYMIYWTPSGGSTTSSILGGMPPPYPCSAVASIRAVLAWCDSALTDCGDLFSGIGGENGPGRLKPLLTYWPAMGE